MESVREKDKAPCSTISSSTKIKPSVIHELDVDSDALLEHVANLGKTLRALLGMSDMTEEVYSTP